MKALFLAVTLVILSGCSNFAFKQESPELIQHYAGPKDYFNVDKKYFTYIFHKEEAGYVSVVLRNTTGDMDLYCKVSWEDKPFYLFSGDIIKSRITKMPSFKNERAVVDCQKYRKKNPKGKYTFFKMTPFL